MARRTSQVCSEPGCPNLKPCEKHPTGPWVNSTRGGSTRQWRKTRARILQRDPMCRACGLNPSTICDHVVNQARGGTDDDWNLQGLCQACSDAKTTKESKAGVG